MAVTVEEGPFGTFGQAITPPNSSNPEIGPSFWYAGDMLLDPRAPFTYQPGQRGGSSIMGWPTLGSIPIIDQVPSSASTTNIINAATPISGIPLTLASASAAGITVGCSVINANTGLNVTGLLGIDVAAARTVTGAFTNGSPKITFTGVTMFGVQVGDQVTFTTSNTLPGGFALLTTYYVVAIVAGAGTGAMMVSATLGGAPISASTAGSGAQTINVSAPNLNTYGVSALTPFAPNVVFGPGGAGTGGPVRYWNPAWASSRTLILTNNGNDSVSGLYTVAGYDYYGYPMTQVLTGPNSSTVNTTKAFKYITSVTPSGTINSTSVSLGTLDTFGLPLRTDMQSYLTVFWGATPPALIAVASATFVAADPTTPSGTTGDVRGTIYGGSSSDGTKRLTVFWTPQPSNMTSTVGLLGQPQF